jgi:hypothetical protein
MSSAVSKEGLWLRASVIGGLWASVEIIIGSFLHNTRIPFAGSVLAFFGTVLLIGFYQIWPYRGLIIRAGLITAIMKSVSPSAIILGPMIGIFLEALLIEGVIILLGNNLLAYITGGILSISSALFHKIVGLIIVYGFNIVKIYVNIINFGLKQMGFHPASDEQILLVLLSFYFVFGLLAGGLGYLIGKKALHLQSQEDTFKWSGGRNSNHEFFSLDHDRAKSIPLLIFHILAIPAGLLLINIEYQSIGYGFMLLYLIAMGIHYRKAVKRLRKPIFWSQLVIIVVLSALFWDFGKPDHYWFSETGFLIGTGMMVRAIFVMVAFSAISVELHNKHVQQFLTRIGLGRFYSSLELAFSALPVMISLLPSSKEIFRSPAQSLLKPLAMANQWLILFKKEK